MDHCYDVCSIQGHTHTHIHHSGIRENSGGVSLYQKQVPQNCCSLTIPLSNVNVFSSKSQMKNLCHL